MHQADHLERNAMASVCLSLHSIDVFITFYSAPRIENGIFPTPQKATFVCFFVHVFGGVSQSPWAPGLSIWRK